MFLKRSRDPMDFFKFKIVKIKRDKAFVKDLQRKKLSEFFKK